MSLHFVLQVNDHAIGACVIRCLDADRGEPDHDAVYRYEVTVDNARPRTGPGQHSRFTAEIEHRYGDGAWVLVQKALAATIPTSGDGP